MMNIEQLNDQAKDFFDQKQFSKMFINYERNFCQVHVENGKFNYMDSQFIIIDLDLEEILDYMKLINKNYKSIYLTS